MSETKKLWKITNKDMTTRGGYKWGLGEWHETSGQGPLCGAGWLHCYEGDEVGGPLLAVLLNPIHGGFDPETMRLFECEGEGAELRDGALKLGRTRLRLVREVPVPVVTTAQRVRFGLYCALTSMGESLPEPKKAG